VQHDIRRRRRPSKRAKFGPSGSQARALRPMLPARRLEKSDDNYGRRPATPAQPARAGADSSDYRRPRSTRSSRAATCTPRRPPRLASRCEWAGHAGALQHPSPGEERGRRGRWRQSRSREQTTSLRAAHPVSYGEAAPPACDDGLNLRTLCVTMRATLAAPHSSRAEVPVRASDAPQWGGLYARKYSR